MLLTDPLYTVRSGPVDRKVTLAALSGNNFSLTGIVVTSGVASLMTLTGAAHTGLTASTENTDVDVHLGRTVQWATGALTLQRFMRIRQPTIGFVGASTVTNAATLQIDGAPIAGTNATLTETAALRVLTGAAAAKGIVIRLATSQTGNWLEAQDSSAATVFYVKSGILSITQFSGGTTSLETASGISLWKSGVNTILSANGSGYLASFTMASGGNIVLDAATSGTKIGTATTQKLGFWNATPVVQQVLATGGGATVDNVITFLQTVGLCKQS